MASKNVSIPKFRENMAYTEWRKKIEKWVLVTKAVKKERGILVSLEGLEGNEKAEKAVSDLTAEELNTDDGLDILLRKLDNIFKSEKADGTYNAYTTFTKFERGNNTM